MYLLTKTLVIQITKSNNIVLVTNVSKHVRSLVITSKLLLLKTITTPLRMLNLIRLRPNGVVIGRFASKHSKERAHCENCPSMSMKYTLIQRLPESLPVVRHHGLRAQRHVRVGRDRLLVAETPVLLLQRLLVRQTHRGLYRRILRLPQVQHFLTRGRRRIRRRTNRSKLRSV